MPNFAASRAVPQQCCMQRLFLKKISNAEDADGMASREQLVPCSILLCPMYLLPSPFSYWLMLKSIKNEICASGKLMCIKRMGAAEKKHSKEHLLISPHRNIQRSSVQVFLLIKSLHYRNINLPSPTIIVP